jgi:imidazolonepropionase-like amidohydrolase
MQSRRFTDCELDGNLGSITPGKFADLILVDGNPVSNISDIRKLRLVMKDGALMETAALCKALGIRP